jgi:hypothetical protein
MRQLTGMINQNILSHFPHGQPWRSSVLLKAFLDCLTMTALLALAVLATLILGL